MAGTAQAFGALIDREIPRWREGSGWATCGQSEALPRRARDMHRRSCGTDLHLLLSLKDDSRLQAVGLRKSPLGCTWLPLTYRNGG